VHSFKVELYDAGFGLRSSFHYVYSEREDTMLD